MKWKTPWPFLPDLSGYEHYTREGIEALVYGAIDGAVAAAVAAEREFCAKLVEEHPRLACHSIADAIRGRK